MMTKIFRLSALFLLFVFATNAAYSVGYTCETRRRYTSCNAGYYMTASVSSMVCDTSKNIGNDCRLCSTMGANYTCAGGTACPVVTCAAGTYLNGMSCTLCGGSAYYCPGGAWTSNGSAQGRHNVTAGYYTTGGADANHRTGQTQCEVGYYCTGGVKAACTNKPANSTYIGGAALNACPWSCNAGYYGGSANGNTSCVVCPAGKYCDGTGYGGTGGKLCTHLGDGSWNLSDPGAYAAAQCYKECKPYDVENGTAVPVASRAYLNNQCQYRGKSLSGNDCDIIDGVCIETSCMNTYEMIDGRCKPCNRAHALSYAADGNCIISSCMIGYHVEGGKCIADARECSVPHATVARQSWDFKIGTYGTCVIEECADGYHIASNACVSDVQPCDVENGVGTKEWNHSAHAWGNCIATSCNAGFTNDPSLTNERWKQCGRCKNKYSIRGGVAVSSYVRECEIAACLYQGELYNLENNECVPICDIDGYQDETGTMKWNPATEKCERRCKAGYVMW